MSTRKARGRRTEEVVAALFRAAGWVNAERRPASLPGDDITGVPGLSVEVKARRGFDPLSALKQVYRRTTGNGNLGIVVLRLDGQGENAAEYAAVLRLGTLVDLLATHPDHRPTPAAGQNVTLGTGMVVYR